MSGEGGIGVRPLDSLLVLFCAAKEREGVTAHRAAGILLCALGSFTPDELKVFKDPPRELDQARISPYVDWRLIGALVVVSRNIIFTELCVFQRLHSGLQIPKEIESVQHGIVGDCNLRTEMKPIKHLCKKRRRRPLWA
jgi:hypothetical protein